MPWGRDRVKVSVEFLCFSPSSPSSKFGDLKQQRRRRQYFPQWLKTFRIYFPNFTQPTDSGLPLEASGWKSKIQCNPSYSIFLFIHKIKIFVSLFQAGLAAVELCQVISLSCILNFKPLFVTILFCFSIISFPFSPRGRFVLQTEILGKFITTFQLF